MRRTVAIVIGLVTALAVANLAIAAARHDGTGKGVRHSQTFRLGASSFSDKDFDLRPAGLSLGDYFVGTEDLFRGAKKVGDDHAVCTITRLQPKVGRPKLGALQCLVTLRLPEGQISLQGTRMAAVASQAPPRFTLAIAGGTGAYRTARGTVRIVDLNQTDSRLTVRLFR